MIDTVDPGGGSMINKEAFNVGAIDTVDPGGGSTINIERINSQLALAHEQVITSVDPGRKDTPETFRA